MLAGDDVRQLENFVIREVDGKILRKRGGGKEWLNAGEALL